jgi:hypothetical protein
LLRVHHVERVEGSLQQHYKGEERFFDCVAGTFRKAER